jgi:hypothetical protein
MSNNENKESFDVYVNGVYVGKTTDGQSFDVDVKEARSRATHPIAKQCVSLFILMIMAGIINTLYGLVPNALKFITAAVGVLIMIYANDIFVDPWLDKKFGR